MKDINMGMRITRQKQNINEEGQNSPLHNNAMQIEHVQGLQNGNSSMAAEENEMAYPGESWNIQQKYIPWQYS